MRFFYIIIMFLCILHDLIHGIILPFCGPDFFYIPHNVIFFSTNLAFPGSKYPQDANYRRQRANETRPHRA